MTDLIYDFITQGIDLMIVGVVLIAMVTLLVAANKLTNVISTQDSMNDRIAKVKEFNQYDNQKVLPQEVGSAIMKYCTSENNYIVCVINETGTNSNNKVIFTDNGTYATDKTAYISLGNSEVKGTTYIAQDATHVGKLYESSGVNQEKMYRAVLLTSKSITIDEDSGEYSILFATTSAASGDVIIGVAFIEESIADNILAAPVETPIESEVEGSE